jgi:hypothetical protein
MYQKRISRKERLWRVAIHVTYPMRHGAEDAKSPTEFAGYCKEEIVT